MAPVLPRRRRKGFASIELLFALGIISLLVGMTIAALGPAKQLVTSCACPVAPNCRTHRRA